MVALCALVRSIVSRVQHCCSPVWAEVFKGREGGGSGGWREWGLPSGWVGVGELRGKLVLPAMVRGECVRNCARKLRLDFIMFSVGEVYLGNSSVR